METSLIPDLQLIGQLEREIEREKQLLDNEETQLMNLTKNASREESSRKNQMKKVLQPPNPLDVLCLIKRCTLYCEKMYRLSIQ